MYNETLSEFRDFFGGLTNFYDYFKKRNLTYQVLYQEGSTRLLYTSLNHESSKKILLIPSLINKSYIFDLDEENSLIKFLKNNGFSVFIIDFLEPLSNEKDLDYKDYLNRITNLVKQVIQLDKFFCLGYCLGAIFSADLSARLPQNVLGQILIACPGDFKNFKNLALKFGYVAEFLKLHDCNLPAIYVQNFFNLINPLKIWRKYSDFFRAGKKKSNKHFILLENWVHDGLGLSKKFVCNMLEMISNDQTFDIPKLQVPGMVIIGEKDRISIALTTKNLFNKRKKYSIYEYQTSHVGLVIGDLAQEKIWPDIIKWCNTRLDK